MEITTDVLVIGAGPSGSIAARTIAEENINVLLIDKKSEIGTPKRCAEGILTSTLDELNIKPDKRWITKEVTGIEITAPNNKTITFDDKTVKLPDTGYILERKVFDKHLVMDAIRKGTKVMIKTRANTVKRTPTGFTVNATRLGQEITIHTKIIIAADGPESRIGKMAGLKSRTDLKNMASCIQYEMANVKLEGNNVKIHIGTVCPGGYIWVFPKGEDIANIGLGILKSHTDKTAKYFLDKFVQNNPILSEAQIVEINVGGDPLGGLVEERYADNIMLVGDAAGFVDPLTGDGIKTAMLSGKYAGIVASKAIKQEDCSKKVLKEYYDLTKEHVGNDFNKYNKVKEFLLTLDDNSLNKIVEEISKSDMSEVTVTKLLKIIIKASPKSILKLGKLL
ncbi:NAD(P)/FAD-dependent oxidoreductase [Methanosphaera sp. ISO3-F5]|uniref:NAD(P)/FAD-dependent oxidoreductase n=1 Tax=Methanosphaera sp. ISO3-F5 TaxID=1452353 RepID=UPI002B258290|nr:NAD(P)/FAD-dependent oxidoreductase [Methanosphaera sp. ISO3-F5]WQH64717.1 NAD(P)/FAD-dependent oxidoreductase [Methanosphaera sp. ISO3-F5]